MVLVVSAYLFLVYSCNGIIMGVDMRNIGDGWSNISLSTMWGTEVGLGDSCGHNVVVVGTICSLLS